MESEPIGGGRSQEGRGGVRTRGGSKVEESNTYSTFSANTTNPRMLHCILASQSGQDAEIQHWFVTLARFEIVARHPCQTDIPLSSVKPLQPCRGRC